MNTNDTPTNASAKDQVDYAAHESVKDATSDTSSLFSAPLSIQTRFEPGEVLKRIAKLSQRGRLPGFEVVERKENSTLLFTATAFGQPFDKTLEARAIANPDKTTTLTFSTKLKPTLPWTFGIIIALSIWPGVWLTDELFRTYFDWYDFATWMWYLPITIVPLPWMVKSVTRKTQASTAESAADLIKLIRTTIDGTAKP